MLDNAVISKSVKKLNLLVSEKMGYTDKNYGFFSFFSDLNLLGNTRAKRKSGEAGIGSDQ